MKTDLQRVWTSDDIVALMDRIESVLVRERGEGRIVISRAYGHVVVSAGSRTNNNGPEVEGHSLDEAMSALVIDLDRWEADRDKPEMVEAVEGHYPPRSLNTPWKIPR